MSVALKKLSCVTELVSHIMKETETAYSGTQYANTWMVYHDALSLMTAADCQEWMKGQYVDKENKISYYDKWILPVLDLNKAYSRFHGKPIGNSPEMMPLDNCLNKDLHESVTRHVLMSKSAARKAEVPTNDPRLFSLKTPKAGSSAYDRIWNPVTGVGPPSRRIIQDIEKVVDAMKRIHAQKGAFVPNLAQRPGVRHIVSELRSENLGGPRTKNMNITMLISDRQDMHADLKEVWDIGMSQHSLNAVVGEAGAMAPEAEDVVDGISH